MQKNEKMKELVLTGLFVAITIIMAFSPLGYIPIGVIRATIVQIPVIIGALFCGPKKGAFLGTVFGLTSCIGSTVMPSLTAFIFSPIVAATQIGPMGAVYSTLICFGPRILVGIIPYFVYKGMTGTCKSPMPRFAVSGVVGSLVNTILVMGLIVVLYRDAYAQSMGVSAGALLGIIATTICVNGLAEAIISGIVVSALGTVLFKIKPIR